MKPKVTLIGKPEYPIGTLYFIWQQSRTNNPIMPVDALDRNAAAYRQSKTADAAKRRLEYPIGAEVEETFLRLLREDVPVTECLYFTFFLQNIPVSLREQLVRHRIGCHVGPEQGLDQIPELGTSTFWSQTSRMVSQEDFYDTGRFYEPDSCTPLEHPVAEEMWDQHDVYVQAMHHAQSAYRELIARGVPMEDARQVLPLAATQSITWTISLKALCHVLGKRACWIAQYNLWADVISQMVDEMTYNVHPTAFRDLVRPPCFSGGKYKECPVKLVNIARMNGEEDQPPCPMFLHYEDFKLNNGRMREEVFETPRMTELKKKFAEAWGLNPVTGEPIKE